MRILITGASGFLGRSIAKVLASAGHSIFTVKPIPIGSTEPHVRRAPMAKRDRGIEPSDIYARVEQVRPDIVVHTAVNYGRNGEPPSEILDANVRFGLLLLQALDTIGRPVSFINTDSALSRDIDFYSLSKHHFVEWSQLLASKPDSAIQFINAKLQLIYGPGDSLSKFVPQVLHSLYKKNIEIDLSSCEQVRDFIYVDDAVRALMTIINNTDKIEKTCEIDVGSGTPCRLKDFVLLAVELLNSNTTLNFGKVPYRKNEEFYLKANTERLRSLGWSPVVDLPLGILLTIREDFGHSSEWIPS